MTQKKKFIEIWVFFKLLSIFLNNFCSFRLSLFIRYFRVFEFVTKILFVLLAHEKFLLFLFSSAATFLNLAGKAVTDATTFCRKSNVTCSLNSQTFVRCEQNGPWLLHYFVVFSSFKIDVHRSSVGLDFVDTSADLLWCRKLAKSKPFFELQLSIIVRFQSKLTLNYNGYLFISAWHLNVDFLHFLNI